MSSPIETTWARTTVFIETETGSTGTGFLVSRSVGDNSHRAFLVTNKHVLHKDPQVRAKMSKLRLHVNVLQNNQLLGQSIDYPLLDLSGSRVREHPSSDVDVLAISVVPLFNSMQGQLANKAVPESWFACAAKRKQMDITAGEEIVVIGYPSGIRQGKTNLPLIRQGLIATRIGEELHEQRLDAMGAVTKRITRGFLIDGATIPGSSGSPVVLKPVTGRLQGTTIMMGVTEPVLLGIVAETRFAPIQTGNKITPGFAGLGLVFDVETIVEVLDLF